MVLILLTTKIFGIPIWLFILLLAILLLLLRRGTRPYSSDEIEYIASRNDERIIRKDFVFMANPPPDLLKKFESSKPLIDRNGEEIRVEIPFTFGPACAAYWLKHKKHQWCIVMHGKRNNEISLMSGNKGRDKWDVEYYRTNIHLFGVRFRSRYDTVLVFHNHPMSVEPSLTDMDLSRAEERSKIAFENDWNYFEFLCIRGGFKRFKSVLSSEYSSIRNYEEKYNQINSRGALAILKSRWIRS